MKPKQRDTSAKQFKPVRTRIRSLNEKERTIEFVASTETVDRYGDVIRVAGWDTRAYEQNPVFLWAHESDKPPIGKCVGIEKDVESGELVQKIQFADRDTYPFADTAFKLYKGGFLNAVSVGFMAKEVKPRYEESEDGPEFVGYEFVEQELMELSAVPVPANPDALARAVHKGVISSAERKEFIAALARFEAEARALCGDSSPWLYLAPGATYSETETARPAEQEPEKSKSNPYGGITGIDETGLAGHALTAGEECPAGDCPTKDKQAAVRPSEQLKAFCDEGRNLAAEFRRELDGIKSALWNIQSDLAELKKAKTVSEDGGASTKTAPAEPSAPAKNTEEKKVIATVEELFDRLVKK